MLMDHTTDGFRGFYRGGVWLLYADRLGNSVFAGLSFYYFKGEHENYGIHLPRSNRRL